MLGAGTLPHLVMIQILSVDDSATMRQMVAATLQGAGYAVQTATNGQEGLAKAAAQNPGFQLVITDVHMPQMDGLTLVRELRKIDKYKFTPILLLTTESSPEKKMEGKAAGATGWMVKPFDPDGLLRTVAKVLG
jgi:two-component system, chemotaxis family, chemotaxis protein CheY